MIAITSFGNQGYKDYGRRMLESFVQYWPTQIVVYFEEKPDFEHDKIIYRELKEAPLIRDFLMSINDEPMCKGFVPQKHGPTIYNYNFDAWKFCRKVFAQYDACRQYDGKVFWIDADTIAFKPIPETFLENLFDGYMLCYLDRSGLYTETGFIGFDTSHQGMDEFMKEYVEIYTSGRFLELKQWHDCAVFDKAREKFGIKEKNLTKDNSNIHVFPTSDLGLYLDHLKGPKRKKQGYSKERMRQKEVQFLRAISK